MALEARKATLTTSLLLAMAKQVRELPRQDRRRGQKQSPCFTHYPAFNAAVFLYPRFFSLLEPDQIEEAKIYLLGLWDQLQAVKGVEELEADVSGEEENVDDVDLPQASDDEDLYVENVLAVRNRARVLATGAGQTPSTSANGEELCCARCSTCTTPKPSPCPKSPVLRLFEKQYKLKTALVIFFYTFSKQRGRV